MSEPSQPPPPVPVLNAWFSPGQRRLISLALSCAAVAVIVLVVYEVLSYLQMFVATFSSVIWPLAIASILSLLLRPLMNYFQKKLRLSRMRAILMLYAFVAAACLLVAVVVLPLIIHQSVLIAQDVPGIKDKLEKKIDDLTEKHSQFFQRLGVTLDQNNHLDKAYLKEYLDKTVGWLTVHLGTGSEALNNVKEKAIWVFEMAAAVAVIPIYMYFLLISDHSFMGDIRQQLTFLKPSLRYDIVFLVEEFVNILISFFRGQFLVGLCLGVIKAFGFTVIGVKFGLVMGLVFGMLNVIPYLGSMLGVCVVLPIALLQDGGGVYLVLLAIGVFVGAHMIESYFLVPKIMGHRTGLHPMVIIISIFFWGKAFNGVLGMILAVPLTAFLVVAWRLLRAKYLPKHGTGLTRFPMPVASTRHPHGPAGK
jgi:predicted PurR-regulated permease PerM